MISGGDNLKLMTEELRKKVAVLEETSKGPNNGMDRQRIRQEWEQQKKGASNRFKSLND